MSMVSTSAKPFVPGASSEVENKETEVETQQNLAVPQQSASKNSQSPRSRQQNPAYYEVYDPYQTEEDQGVKYTCRYDIQIDNEKEF